MFRGLVFRVKLFLTLMLVPLLAACASSGLAKKSDYLETRQLIQKEKYKLARKAFPPHEKGGFITTVEKAWLELLVQTPDTERLLEISDSLAKRDVTYISEEAKHFFYAETEEGYFPAEHEIVWLHIVTGLAFAKSGDRERARVEAKRAAIYLERGYTERRKGQFDDAGLRMVLASLWLYAGEWEQARVDFRVASQLAPKYSWAKEFAEKDRPPKNLVLVFGGDGPEAVWRPESAEQNLTGLGSVKFAMNFEHQDLLLLDGKKDVAKISDSLSTEAWYKRHVDRNTEIRELISGSSYMVKATTVHTTSTAGKVGGGVVAGTIGVLGIAAGGALVAGAIYLVIQAGASEGSGEFLAVVVGLGVALAGKAVKAAKRIFTDVDEEMDEFKDNQLNLSNTYRFVRFLPERFYAYAGEGSLKSPEIENSNGRRYKPFLGLSSPKNESHVYFYHIPAHVIETGY